MSWKLGTYYQVFWALIGSFYACTFLAMRLQQNWLAGIGLVLAISTVAWGKHTWNVRRVYNYEIIRAMARRDARRMVSR
jgi:hypothetical protein